MAMTSLVKIGQHILNTKTHRETKTIETSARIDARSILLFSFFCLKSTILQMHPLIIFKYKERLNHVEMSILCDMIGAK